MSFYYALRNVAAYIGDFSTSLLSAASQIQNVYIIGQYLAFRFITWGVSLSNVRAWLYNAADDWLDAYNDLKNNSVISGALYTLQYWADDLSAFASDPDGWIRDAIRRYFPRAARLMNDPAGEIVDVILNYTNLPYDLVFSPNSYIRNIFNNALGSLKVIYNDPDGWLLSKINQYFPVAVAFLRDPDGWIIQKIYSKFPTLNEFLRDPDLYIVEKFLAFIERFIDRYGRRLAQIAEKIILLLW